MKLCKLVTSWCRNFELRIALPIAMSVLSSMLMSTAQVQAQSIHNIWYVSKAPGSMPSDGRSWRSAWGELDQIVWDSVQPGFCNRFCFASSLALGCHPKIEYLCCRKLQSCGGGTNQCFGHTLETQLRKTVKQLNSAW